MIRPFLASRVSHCIEPLEARIAPAVIRIGAIGPFEDPSDTEYVEVVDPNDPNRGPRPAPFNVLGFTDTSTSTDLISQQLNATAGDTYFLRLQAGDVVFKFTQGSNYREFINVRAGQVVAFFTDLNGNKEFDEGELTGLSLGANVIVDINGSVNGDIVTNLDERRTRDRSDDRLDLTGLVSPTQGIRSLRVLGGAVFGDVISGGPIAALTVATNVENVFAGAAASGASYDFFQSAGGEGTVTFNPLPGQIGASISSVVVGSITGTLAAGAGGAGAKGGSLLNIQVTDDSDGFQLLAGAGGSGDAPSRRIHGGAGGTVTNITIGGIDDGTPNSGSGILIRAGDGGTAETSGRGGVGGFLRNVNVGYEFLGTRLVSSTALVADNVLLAAGEGGDGKFGGAGGAASVVRVRVLTPDVQGNEIELRAGDGGDSVAPGGAGGIGGSVRDFDLRNRISTADGDIVVEAGDGGDGGATSRGAAGGSVLNASVLGFDVQILAGDGSGGTVGGLGGSVTNALIVRDDQVIARNVLVNAGQGGIGFAGSGGAGGSVGGVTSQDGDFQSFVINAGTAGNGGAGFVGVGGRGGRVFAVNMTDGNSILGDAGTIEGNVSIRAGIGGEGSRGGGAGGAVERVTVTGDNLNMSVIAGAGGDVLTNGRGNGGIGGSISAVQIESTGFVNSQLDQEFFTPVTGELIAGAGGDGKGSGGSGGAGGDVKSSSSVRLSGSPEVLVENYVGNAQIIAGDGGSGEVPLGAVRGGGAGRGGSILGSGVFADQGSGLLQAGDGGLNGVRAAAGGRIAGIAGTQIGLRATTTLMALAGDGTHGGAGGDIIDLAYGSTAVALTPTPTGAILIQAGDGSALGAVAGRGGSIQNVNGSVSSGIGMTTQFFAGDGGGNATALRSGAGGFIRNITVSRGGAEDGLLTFQAGDGGDSPLAAVGGAGGSVLSIGVTDITASTTFRSVAAGDGGDARRGGIGGSITGIDVQEHDIGVRTGKVFGFTSMGGLFAGLGGDGARPGLNGSVTSITADSISAIVAGRSLVPEMAERVSDVYVAGSNKTLLMAANQALIPNGSFQLKFGADTTPLLVSGSTALEVEQALNLLPGVAALGGVKVTSSSNGGYSIQFNNPGNQTALSGVEVLEGEVLESTRGATGNFTATTGANGAVVLPVTEVRSGQEALTVVEISSGNALFSTSEQVAGDLVTAEIQVLNLQGLDAFPTGQFTLRFAGATTPLLPVTADAAAIEAALDALPPIAALVPPGVTVAAVTGQDDRFTITFNAFGAQETIIGTRFLQEIQRLDLGQVPDFGSATFTLSFGGQTTAPLASNADAATIAGALNALPTISAPAAGGVTVTDVGNSQFDIRFGANGEQVPVVGAGLLPELQSISLASSAPASARFTISLGNDKTGLLPLNATPAAIQAALNALPGVQAAGGVTVAAGTNGTLEITFTQTGDKQSFTSEMLQSEQQSINVNALNAVPGSEYVLSALNNLTVEETSAGTQTALNITETTAGEFNFSAITVTNGNAVTAETQRIDIAQVTGNGAMFTLTFAGQTTTPISPLGGTAAVIAAIQNAINLLPAVVAVSGITVSSAGGTNYNLLFGRTGNQELITGTGVVPEVQQVALGALFGDPTAEFTLTFGGETTVAISAANTANQTLLTNFVDTALDALTPIAAEGGVFVQFVSPGVFNVRFNQVATPANQPLIVGQGGGATSHEHQRLDLGSLLAYSSGSFQLNFGGQTTVPLTKDATPAQIKAALDALPTVQASRPGNTGAVIVTSLGAGLFDVEFNSFGPRNPITSEGTVMVDRYPILVSETAAGTQLPVLVSETRSGTFTPAEVSELVQGTPTVAESQRLLLTALNGATSGDFTVRFGSFTTLPIALGATAAQVQVALNALQSVQLAGGVTVTAGAGPSYDVTFNTAAGDRPSFIAQTRVSEIQLLDLGGISALAGGEFTLSYGGGTTAPLPASATAAQVGAALNGLPAIQALGGVDVTAAGAGKFTVGFQSLGNATPIEGVGGGTAGRETQQISLANLQGVAGGRFQLTFDGQTTPVLPVTATAAEIAAALNGLESVRGIRSDLTGAVAVTAGAPGIFNVSFNTFGDLPALNGRSFTTTDRTFGSTETLAGNAAISVPISETTPGTPGVQEQQTINLSAIRGAGGVFQLRFDNNPSDGIPASITDLLPATSDAFDIENALNALPTIGAAGGVSVVGGAGDDIIVTFNPNGAQQAIVGLGGVAEQQRVDLGVLATQPGGLFRLVFNGESTRALAANALPADIDAAISALANIKALRPNNTGAVDVVAVAPGVFRVDFLDVGNQSALSGVATVAITPSLDIREISAGGSMLTLPISEAVNGQEIMVFATEFVEGDLIGGVLPNDGLNDTQEIQRVNLSSIAGVIGSGFTLQFGTETTPFLSRFATAVDIQTALNALPSVVTAGGVTVGQSGVPNTFNVIFNQFGNQVELTAKGGIRELQKIDSTLLQLPGNAEIQLTFSSDGLVVPADSTPVLQETVLTPARIAFELNLLPDIFAVGGVTVTQGSNGFDVFFNVPGNYPAITGTNSILEAQLLDLQTLPATDGAQFKLTFGANTTGPIDATASDAAIQNALNAPAMMIPGGVVVTSVSPGVFRIDFNAADNHALITGTANTFGTSTRLTSASTPEEIEAALDAISFFDISASAGTAPGETLIQFGPLGDQPAITVETYIHERQRVDVFSTGTFTLQFGDDVTAPLAFNASADQVRTALDALPAVKAVGGIRSVEPGENSHFVVTFASDTDVAFLRATQTLQPIPVTTTLEGNATTRETQLASFVTKGSFVGPATTAFVGFHRANFVGAIYDFNEIDSTVFHWIENNGIAGFNEGDTPIDGIVMARLLDQRTINFTPEARFTATGFFDSNNRL